MLQTGMLLTVSAVPFVLNFVNQIIVSGLSLLEVIFILSATVHMSIQSNYNKTYYYMNKDK